MKKIPEAKPLFLERMQKLLNNEEDYKKYLKILKIPILKSIRCNTIKITPDKLKKRLEEKGWKINQPWKEYPEVMIVEGKIAENNLSNDKKTVNKKNSLLINKFSDIEHSEANLEELEPGDLGRSLEHLLGYYYVQELASMLPIIALAPKPNEIFLDLCASPGSKTTQIAAKMQNTGTIIANEISLGRIKILAANLERCGVANTIITRKEGAALCKQLEKANLKEVNGQGTLVPYQFDKILIDAPCSGEGTLRSGPKTYLMWNIKTIKHLPRIQKNLFKPAINLLKINGKIIYSTCTHAPEENEAVIDEILREFNNLKIEEIKLPIKCRPGIEQWEGKKYLKDVTKSCRVYPQDNNTEGFFIAKFKRMR